MVACVCNDVTDWEVERYARFADSPKDLAYLAGIDYKCGKCAALVKRIWDAEQQKRDSG